MNKDIITAHAVERYRERIGPMPANLGEAKRELLACLCAGKPRHLRKLLRKKKTVYVPTGCCLMVAHKGIVVTVLPRPQEGLCP